MNLDYAVDRLYESGWLPRSGADLERLDDGRWFPSVRAVRQEFSRRGLELSLKQNLIFRCVRAAWEPKHQLTGTGVQSAPDGTVVGSCEREAAVYALAHILSNQGTSVDAGSSCVNAATEAPASLERRQNGYQ